MIRGNASIIDLFCPVGEHYTTLTAEKDENAAVGCEAEAKPATTTLTEKNESAADDGTQDVDVPMEENMATQEKVVESHASPDISMQVEHHTDGLAPAMVTTEQPCAEPEQFI